VAGDQVGAVVELGQQPRHLGRVVLQVGVHRDDPLAACLVDGRGERGGLAEVAPQPQRAHPRVGGGQLGHHRPAAVHAAVVDEDHLVLDLRQGLERSADLGHQRGERRLLVLDRDQHADLNVWHGFNTHYSAPVSVFVVTDLRG
jgi:hypothetical protein